MKQRDVDNFFKHVDMSFKAKKIEITEDEKLRRYKKIGRFLLTVFIVLSSLLECLYILFFISANSQLVLQGVLNNIASILMLYNARELFK